MVNNKLRLVRQDVGMTLTELAKRAGASRETITNIELHGQVPNGVLMLKISEALNKDPRDIFFTVNANHDLQKSNQ